MALLIQQLAAGHVGVRFFFDFLDTQNIRTLRTAAKRKIDYHRFVCKRFIITLECGSDFMDDFVRFLGSGIRHQESKLIATDAGKNVPCLQKLLRISAVFLMIRSPVS
jgi:hypothetical protein